jgi:type II secretory pathway predicted ATPase ExeA
MELDQGLNADRSRQNDAGDFLPAVASRRQALDRLHAATGALPPGPSLVTGEPGAGKTWLARRFRRDLPGCWRASSVDLTRAMNALDFLRLIAHPLGATASKRLGVARLRLREMLEDEAADGRPWLLVIDEAQRGAPALWDEIQAIVNQLGQPGGFAAVAVVGQTELARALVSRRLRAFASSLRAHVHLRPLDLDETSELLSCTEYTDAVSRRAIELVHRDAGGNPRLLLRLAELRPGPWRTTRDSPSNGDCAVFTAPGWQPRAAVATATDEALETTEAARVAERAVEAATGAGSVASALIPSKPPIRDEDGLVEVGWDGDLDAELGATDGADSRFEAIPATDSNFDEELIEDRYADLQAWEEQKQNAAVLEDVAPAPPPPVVPSDDCGETGLAPAPNTPAGFEPAATTARPGVRAEGQHEIPPSSQLFSRYRQSKQPGP